MALTAPHCLIDIFKKYMTIKKKLECRRSILKSIGIVAVGIIPLSGWRRKAIGFSLNWESVGSDVTVHYIRFQGGTNEQKQYMGISKRSPKQFAYMPGDTNGMPEWMEVDWVYGVVDAETAKLAHQYAKPAKARFDLKALIPQSAIDEVMADRGRKQLKLTFTFNEDQLDMRYEIYTWR